MTQLYSDGRLLKMNFLFTGDLEQGELDLITSYPSLPS